MPGADDRAGPRARLRHHQALALDRLETHWQSGSTRAWVELPPGAGKTLVGLLAAERLLAGQQVRRVVVLSPNTAIQGQWLRAASEFGMSAGADRTLTSHLTALTYQSVAVFDPDSEVDEDGAEVSLLGKLHENGTALVAELRSAGALLLVLDECHHLVEVWGRLLGELLAELPEARVLGLTATPPDALTVEQAALVDDLFGAPAFQASIPAVVRHGDLAPYAELAWLVTPTPTEADWLAGQAQRFTELITALTDPTMGSTGFLAWADRRFLAAEVGWAEVARGDRRLADAALRMHHAGLLALPEGARVREEHRVDPSADDWVELIDDWLVRGPARSGEPADEALVESVRRALPSVGYQWTRRGIRRGRSPVDRVLARSEAKTAATVEIVGVERRNLGERLRMLVLCDHERASATLPVDLRGVLDAQSGSAWAALRALAEVTDPTLPRALLVTGSTVAGAPDTIAALHAFVGGRDAQLAAGLAPEMIGGDLARLGGSWSSRQWVPHVTAFFEQGHAPVLVGTRGLLGEGWDARAITGLVDLTAVTTATAVVQTRGRALRSDPAWAEKVALTWSVVCVAVEHPKGGNDWNRLVRKHEGFFGVDDSGDIVDGVGHMDASFSPYAPPDPATFDAINARMITRSEDRAAIAARWAVGDPYQDSATTTLRLLPGPRARAGALVVGGADPAGPVVVVGPDQRLTNHGDPTPRPGAVQRTLAGSGLLAATGWTAVATGAVAASAPTPGLLGAAAILTMTSAAAARARQLVGHGRSVLDEAARPPTIGQVARAVADALHECGLVTLGAQHVHLDVEPNGEYRCALAGVTEAESTVFATALDEALSPIVRPRYVIPHWTTLGLDRGWRAAIRASRGRVEPPNETWHPVPSVLGSHANRAAAYGRSWQRWVGGGDPVYTGSPEGAGILAAQQGADPFDVTSVMRRHWS